MTTINTSAADVTFRVRPLGFDRGEVQAFIGNLLNDYAQVTRELDRLRNEMTAMRDFTSERKPIPDLVQVVAPVAGASAASSSAREVERILAGAERLGEEIRIRAQEESETALRDADNRVAALMLDAQTRGGDMVKEAEARAAEILDSAVKNADNIDRQAMAIRAHCAQMRSAIKGASEAAAQALKQISTMEEDREPALQAKR